MHLVLNIFSNIFRFQGQDKYSLYAEQFARKEEYLSSAICRLNFWRSTAFLNLVKDFFEDNFFLQDFYFSGLNYGEYW